MLDEHGFGDHGTRAAGTGESGDRRQQMQKQDGQIAHRTILPRSRNPRNAHEFGNSPCTGSCAATAGTLRPANTLTAIGINARSLTAASTPEPSRQYWCATRVRPESSVVTIAERCRQRVRSCFTVVLFGDFGRSLLISRRSRIWSKAAYQRSSPSRHALRRVSGPDGGDTGSRTVRNKRRRVPAQRDVHV